MRPVLILAALVACRQNTQSPAVPSNTNAPTMVDQEFARRAKLDYSRPMSGRWMEGVVPYLDFKGMCEAGDRPACLRSTMKGRATGDAMNNITTMCWEGDELSCRYDTWYRKEFVEPYPFTLSSAELRRGCTAGIKPECTMLAESTNVDDRRFGAELSCIRAKRECIRAAESYLNEEPRSKLRAQYYLEVQCQTFGGRGCQVLADLYRTKVLEAPVPGRAEALERYVCSYDREYCRASKNK